MKKINSELVLIILVAFWGLSFSMTKPFLSSIGVFNFLALRFLIGGGLLLGLLLISNKINLSKGIIKASIVSGVLLFLAFACHIIGLKYTSIAKNSFIVGSSVIFIPIIMLLVYRVKSDMMTIYQTGLAILGLGIITLLNTSSAFNFGDLITMIGSLFYALYTVQVEKSVKTLDINMFTAIQLCTVGLISLTTSLIFENTTLSFTSFEWLNILFLSVLLTGVAYYILNSLQRKISASNVTLIFTLEPFFAILFGWFFLKEAFGFNVILGGLLIIISVLLPTIQGKLKMTHKNRRRYEY